jgi:hypothetical protein
MRVCKICGIDISDRRKDCYICTNKKCINQNFRDYYQTHLSIKLCKYCSEEFYGTGKKLVCDRQECQKLADLSKSPKQEILVPVCCKFCKKTLANVSKKLTGLTKAREDSKVCEECKLKNREQYSINRKLNNPNRKILFSSLEEYNAYHENQLLQKEAKKLQSLASQKERMKISNPMFNTEVAEKAKNTFKQNIASGKTVFPRGTDHKSYKGNRPLSFFLRLQLKPWRKSIFERDSYKCTNCNSKDCLHVHHTVPFREILEKFNIKNLKGPTNLLDTADLDKLVKDIVTYHEQNPQIGITLCPKCHGQEDEYFKAATSKKIKNQENWH